MEIKGVPIKEINAIAAECGFTTDASLNNRGHIRFRIFPTSDRQRKLSTGWGSMGRRVNAVCWHGHRDFMYRLFDKFPCATLKTSIATYRGLDDFTAKFNETGWKNVGPMIAPVFYREACKCEEI